MPLVADSSPLILLGSTGQIAFLRPLYGEVLVPPAVWDEVFRDGGTRPGAVAIAAQPWIRRRAISPVPSTAARLGGMGAGESAALALAATLSPPPFLLVDDRRARREADRLSVPTVGTGGILVLAKRAGLVAQVKPRLDVLRDAGWYASSGVIDSLLRSAGEA